MTDPFETPEGFAWSYPCFGLAWKGTKLAFHVAADDGTRMLPLFTDFDLSERFVQENGLADSVDGVVIRTADQLRASLAAAIGSCRAVLVDPGHMREDRVLTVIHVGHFLDLIDD